MKQRNGIVFVSSLLCPFNSCFFSFITIKRAKEGKEKEIKWFCFMFCFSPFSSFALLKWIKKEEKKSK